MALHSMTGFARESGSHDAWRFSWEIRSVNGRGLEVKFKLPPGFEQLAEPLRRTAASVLQRGSVFAILSIERDARKDAPVIDVALLDRLVEAARSAAARHGLKAPRIEALMGIRGVVEAADIDDDDEREAAHRAVTTSFAHALEAVSSMRAEEGRRLHDVLEGQIATIERLTASAETCPARRPEAIRERLAKQLRELTEQAPGLDAQRLHQEAMLIASRADIREEIDRLHAHIAQARDLIGKGGAVGRRLDFLAQEFGREANTLTAKANDVELSRIGLELKGVIEQWREQVQNVE